MIMGTGNVLQLIFYSDKADIMINVSLYKKQETFITLASCSSVDQ